MGMTSSAPVVSGDFDLTMDELRVVARYVVQHAEDVLPVFEQAVPDDPRPRAAIDAAWAFIDGAGRARRQRVTSLDAHRAARSAPSESARLAARAAGDAASAAYLHPIARPTRSATSSERPRASRASGSWRPAATRRSATPCWNGRASVRPR
ncbi:hypothetical protein GCM10023169_26560 [Georgenia halophila]|uniref:Imm-5-like domain-containing protein n=1 Tax=Georgenia halophila TaxID=620889 RepID=A0ABP8LEH0_9MICO